jgi:hypothetical protein
MLSLELVVYLLLPGEFSTALSDTRSSIPLWEGSESLWEIRRETLLWNAVSRRVMLEREQTGRGGYDWNLNSDLCAHLRVKQIPQTLAEKVKCHNGYEHGNPRCQIPPEVCQQLEILGR